MESQHHKHLAEGFRTKTKDGICCDRGVVENLPNSINVTLQELKLKFWLLSVVVMARC